MRESADRGDPANPFTSGVALERFEISTLSSRKPSLCNIQVGHWQDMQSGLGGGTVDKELLDFEAGLDQEAGARVDEAFNLLVCLVQLH